MRSNLAGMVAHPIIPDLGAFDFNALPRRPRAGARASRRATRSAWSTRSPPPTSRPARASTTACPRRSQEVVATYGQRCFKLKVGGDRAADLDRLVAHRRRPRRRRRPAARHARRQRAVRRRRVGGRAVERDGGRAGAAEAVRGDALHRAADQAPGRAGAQRRAAGAAPAGDHRRVRRRARRASCGRARSATAASRRRTARASTSRWSTWRAAGSGTPRRRGRLLPLRRGPDDAGRASPCSRTSRSSRCSASPTSSATAITSSTASTAGRTREPVVPRGASRPLPEADAAASACAIQRGRLDLRSLECPASAPRSCPTSRPPRRCRRPTGRRLR